MPAPAATRTRSSLRAGLDEPWPNIVRVGAGTAVALSGWCFHPTQPIERLEIEIDGQRHPVELGHIQRRDLVEQFGDAAQWSGFAAIAPIAAAHRFRELDLRVAARFQDGSSALATLARLGPNRAVSQPQLVSPRSPQSTLTPSRIAVCMTTYNPRPDLFARQVDSLRAQSERDWTCIVCDDHSNSESFARIRSTLGDDPRFRLYRQPANAGFYHNFEQCLSLVPSDAEFVALCDQDDKWNPDKLTVLRGQFGPQTKLVYSDARIVTDDGRVLAPTYWTTRRPNRGDLGSLLIANTVTGAAAMIRRDLLDVVLPFPPRFGAAFHDHWLACAALATGDIVYLDRPLYDYVQHGRNVIGHYAPAILPLWTRIWRWCKFFWPLKVAANVKEALGDGRTHYFDNVMRVRQVARTVLVRCGDRLSVERRRDLERTARPLDLLMRGFRFPSGVSPTVGMEFCLLRAHIWAAYMRIKALLCAPVRSRQSIEDVADDLRRKAA